MSGSGKIDDEWLAAARLARRSGFGATGAEIDKIMTSGPDAHLAEALTADPSADPGAVATPAPAFEQIPPLGKNADADAKKQRRAELKEQLQDLTSWWLSRMISVREPLPEKLTLMWHNHFATSASKVRSATLMLGQNRTIRDRGRGNFRTLALSMLTDAAMLYWLDGQKNVAGSANENLSREFMELFTLGHGNGYTELDVRNGARALTGWKINRDGSAAKVPARHDSGVKTVLGVTGDLDETGFCDAILAQPAAADYVVARIWSQLGAGDSLPAGSLATLAATFRAEWGISALLTQLLRGSDFTAASGRIVVGPVEWLVGAVRALQLPIDDPAVIKRLLRVLQALGQVPFYPPSVGGWPSGQAWLSTAAADVRFTTAAALVRTANLDAISSLPQAGRVEATAYLLGVGTWSDRSRLILQDAAADPRKLVAIALNTSEYLTN